MFRIKIQFHGSHRLVCLGLECSAKGAADGVFRLKLQGHGSPISVCFGSNVVQWDAQTYMFRLKIQCYGRLRPVCLGSKCSAMGCPDWCVQAQNGMPWEAQIGVFRLTMQCHGRPRPTRLTSTYATLCSGWHTAHTAHTVVPEIAIQCHIEVKTDLFEMFYTVPMRPMSSVPGPRRQCHKRPRLALLGFPIQSHKQREETVSVEAQRRDSHTVPLGGQTSHLGLLYTVPVGRMELCSGASQTVPWPPQGLDLFLPRAFYKTVSLKQITNLNIIWHTNGGSRIFLPGQILDPPLGWGSAGIKSLISSVDR